jgi:uncharacterized protein
LNANQFITVDTVLLKVTSRCNLDCSYCYVYHEGDNGWLRQPKRMSAVVAAAAARRIGDLARGQRKPISIVLHGGEPLLLPLREKRLLLSALRSNLPPDCGVHLQTNGLLLDDNVIELCAEHDVGISISLDGPAELHDENRKTHLGKGSQAHVLRAIRRLQQHPKGMNLFSGVLAVVDPRSDPSEVYRFFKSISVPSVDFLYRDGNWSKLPSGKAEAASIEYGRWMATIADIYLSDPEPLRIRILDDLLRMLLGGRAVKEGVGLDDYGILIVETDGSICRNDTLKSVSDGADRFAAGWNVLSDTLESVTSSAEFAHYHALQKPTSTICNMCPDLNICGGGTVAHRWSSELGYDNPTVYCADQKYLIRELRRQLRRHLGLPIEPGLCRHA